MPFTYEEFVGVFLRYNADFGWLSWLALVAALAVLWAIARQAAGASRAALALCAVLWVVNGLGYHAAYFTAISPAAWGFAALFAVQALLLARAALDPPPLRFGADPQRLVALALIVFALLVYPVWGALAGQSLAESPRFGIAPCPTTIFTIGLLLLGEGPKLRRLLILPAVWAAIGGSAAFLLRVPQDLGLLAALAVVLWAAATALRGPRTA